ncbi:MAG: LysR family transcriptional regulator [Halioglobus sp.]|jgi:DNA-binding transcriptional LysR family regulator|nr:LysR substrate binding domain protein [marine gamma proteobacterium HTCC2148]MBT3410872.1 LysR family transcriptional regulator [Halieaceae bacterium]MBT5006360.1 LysR family transcriptional regulator [Halieaceae bacterium]MDG1387724.1 LysR family transcriptional regulator [Halioglobus sp.]MDG2325367.1 LysR family transcriptional regulator [Halioglobus sp.]
MASHRWESIEAFERVVRLGSFTRAADDLGVSRSHVSRQINALENRLDAQLLLRTTRKVSTTDVGQAFYMQCRQVLDNLDEAERAVLDLQANPRGILRVTVAGAFGEDFIAPAALDFMAEYRDLIVELNFSNRLIDLISEGYDVAIRAGTLKDSSLIARRISTRKLLTCASPEYLLRNGTPSSIHSLTNHNCLLGTLDSWRFRENGRNQDLRVSGNWRSNNGRSLLRAARAGLGLVQLPSFYLDQDIIDGALLPVLEDYNPTDTGVWAVYPHNRHLSAKVRLFVNFLADRFNE